MHPFEVHGSHEFSWHWNQLQGMSEITTSRKPFSQVNGSQIGSSAPARPHIGEQQSGAFLDGISLWWSSACRGRIDDVVVGLLDDAAGLVHQPAVIVAADAGLLDHAVREVRAPMRTMPVDQGHSGRPGPCRDEILAHQANGL